MNNFLIALCVSLAFSPFIAIAQDDLDREIQFVKEGKIEPPQATRNYEKIDYNPPPAKVKPQSYDYAVIPTELSRLDMKIKVRTLNPDELKKLYGNYVKAGFGNYATPYFEGFFSSKRSDKYIYSLHARHLSSARGPVSFAKTSENLLDATGTIFSEKVAVDGRLFYQRNRYNYYGFDHEIPFTPSVDTLKQVYNLIGAFTQIRNLDQTAALNYNLGINYWKLNSLQAHENEVMLSGNSSYYIASNKDLDVSGVYSYSSRTKVGEYSRSFFQLKPAFILKDSLYKLTAGFNVAYSSDTALSHKFHLYPRLQGEYHLLPKELTVFGGIDGELQKNTLRSFVSENPYLNTDAPLANTSKAFEAFAGVNGNILERLNYKARFAYQAYKYLYFFRNSQTDTSKFTLVYDTGNTNVVNLLGAVSYDFTEKYRLGLNANYYSYTLSNLPAAWHRPTFDLSILNTYNIYKKIYFNLDLFYLSGIKAVNSKNAEVKLPSIFDINAKVDYRFSDAFSAFIQLNNILSKKYERYLNYPVKGINVLVGASYTF